MATGAVAAIALIVLGVGGYFFLHRAPKLTEKDTIVISDFANSTGDAAFDDTLKQALTTELGQSPFLNMLSDQKLTETLRMMGRQPNERLTKEVAREICLRTASTAMLTGSIGQIGSHYNLVLNAVNCPTGDVLASVQTEIDDKNHVLSGLGQLGTQMREVKALNHLSRNMTDLLNRRRLPQRCAGNHYARGQGTGQRRRFLAVQARRRTGSKFCHCVARSRTCV